tara:strand:+ start:344 stop:580 length:237 start_codon:yes stop_codon:yes gene_type:complete
MVFRKNVRNNERKTQVNTYQEGMKAFREGSLGNPYPTNTERNKSWEFGFNKAYFFNLEQVKKHEGFRKRSKKVHKEKV